MVIAEMERMMRFVTYFELELIDFLDLLMGLDVTCMKLPLHYFVTPRN